MLDTQLRTLKGAKEGVRVSREKKEQQRKGIVRCTGLWKEVLAWGKVVKQMKSIEEEACWPGHAAVAPGWQKKLFSNVWQMFTAG